jgi:ankyrin repeat protein
MADQEFHGIRATSPAEALALAAAGGRVRVMELLLADGADVNGVAPYSGGTPLHAAAGSGSLPAVEALVRAGADLNPTDRMGLTPLMSACALGKVKGSRVALRLVEAGADVRRVRAADGMTALKFAVHTCPPEVIQVLIDRGAEVDGPPGTDQTALMLAARANNVESLRVLVANGADVSLRCKLPWAGGRTAEGLAELEKRRAALAYLRGLSGG